MVPDVQDLKLEICDKIYKYLCRTFYSEGMNICVEEDIFKYVVSKEVKIEYQGAVEELQYLHIPKWKMEHITVDFVYGLGTTMKQHNRIWVIVNQLTKWAYFLPIQSANLVKELDKVYVDKGFKLHGLSHL